MSKVVTLIGPIKHWWDANWGTKAHNWYVVYRDDLSRALVDAGFLVYRPHEAFKGAWDERAQVINDYAMKNSDLMINMTPPGVPSPGTDGEMALCVEWGAQVLHAPPPTAQDTNYYVLDVVERAKAMLDVTV